MTHTLFRTVTLVHQTIDIITQIILFEFIQFRLRICTAISFSTFYSHGHIRSLLCYDLNFHEAATNYITGLVYQLNLENRSTSYKFRVMSIISNRLESTLLSICTYQVFLLISYSRATLYIILRRCYSKAV